MATDTAHATTLGFASGLLAAAFDSDAPAHHRVAFVRCVHVLLEAVGGTLAPPPARESDGGGRAKRRVKPKLTRARARKGSRKDPKPPAPTMVPPPAAEEPQLAIETPAPQPVDAPAIEIDPSEIVERDGISVWIKPGVERIQHAGREVELNARQAALAAALVRATPVPVDRTHLINKVWKGRAPACADTVLGAIATDLRTACEPIGLVVKTVRGVGISIQRAE